MVERRPRALLITPIQPARTGLGLAMRMGLMAEALASIAELHVIIVPVAGTLPVSDDLLDRLGAQVHRVDLTGGSDTVLTLLSAIDDPAEQLAAFARYGKPSLAGMVGPRPRAEIAGLAERIAPDLVVIGRAYLAHLVDLMPVKARLIVDLDEDDVRSCASQAREMQRTDPVGARWMLQEGEAIRRLIDRASARIQLALAAAPRDALALRQRHDGLPVVCVPNAIHRPAPRLRPASADRPGRAPTILFVGALGYEPNVRAMLWFTTAVLPRLRRSLPSLRLVIAGARPDGRMQRLGRRAGIALLADPASVAPLYARAQLVIAPLLDGGGTRIKLIEAAAHRKPVVATPAARAGLGMLPGMRCAPAQPAPFARACLDALNGAGPSPAVRIPRRFDAAYAIPALARRLAGMLPPDAQAN